MPRRTPAARPDPASLSLPRFPVAAPLTVSCLRLSRRVRLRRAQCIQLPFTHLWTLCKRRKIVTVAAMKYINAITNLISAALPKVLECIYYAEFQNNHFIGNEGRELTGENTIGQGESQPADSTSPTTKQVNYSKFFTILFNFL